VAFFLSACSISKIKEQIKVAEDIGAVKGKVKVENNQQGTVVVAILQQSGNTLTVKNRLIASAEGDYTFHVPPGDYLVGAFVDKNNDGVYTTGEHASFYGDSSKVSVKPAQVVYLDAITIRNKPLVLQENIKVEVDRRKILENIGRVVSLNDPMFNEEYYSTGLWEWMDFLKDVGGGLFLLEEYNKDKIPVLFIHGIGGGPHNWDKVIEGLDRDRYQPWMLYYPSGVRLDIVSDYVLRAITDL